MNVKDPVWRILPIVAIVMAASFIAWDVALMSRTSKGQKHLNIHVAQLDALGRINTAVDQLMVAHIKDHRGGEHGWAAGMDSARALIGQQFALVPTTDRIADLQASLKLNLVMLDSLHRETRRLQDEPARAQMVDAVFGLVVRKMRADVEATLRVVQTEGLVRETGELNNQWTEAHILLALASLLALACAALVAFVYKLLAKANERSALLTRTGKELERTNRNLRETMLSKEEKEVMLKEIHHRVKNNLQIVRSLIRFQMDKVKEPHTTELFNECVNRVGAMALVHEQTYMSKDLANINVTNYFNSLIRDLVYAYNIRMKLNLDVKIEVETLGVDTLTPLGLLINEVVSNSFKHAFKGRDEGSIILHLSGTEEGGLYMRIGDDGVGLPDADKWKNPNSLGMELIHTLTGQLNATMTMQPGPGMVYELISQPETEVRRRA